MTTHHGVGIVGAGPIGSGLTHNLVRNAIPVVLHSRSAQRPKAARNSAPSPGLVRVAKTMAGLIEGLPTPRVIIAAVSDANTPVVLAELLDLLDAGDIVVDVSNADAVDTRRRQREYSDRGAFLLAGGLASGGQGATHGTSLTLSGDEGAFGRVRPLVEATAAVVDGRPCVSYLGEGSSSHLVKTIHNGLEYSIMQLLAELVVVLRELCGVEPAEIPEVLGSWNASVGSYIVTVAGDAAQMGVAEGQGVAVMDVVLDRVDHNGSGARAAVHALRGDIFDPSSAISILARLSSDRGEVGTARPRDDEAMGARPVLTTEQAHEAFVDIMEVLHHNVLNHLRETARLSGGAFDADRVWDSWRGATIASSFHASAPARAGQDASVPAGGVSPGWKALVAAAATAGMGLPMMSGLLAFVASQRSPRSYACVLQLMRHQLGASPYVLVETPAQPRGASAEADGTTRHTLSP